MSHLKLAFIKKRKRKEEEEKDYCCISFPRVSLAFNRKARIRFIPLT